MTQLLIARVGPYLFGAPVDSVTEILARPAVTPIPRTPPVVAGVSVVRGQPLAVFTARASVGLDPAPIPIALRWQGGAEVVLIAVDQVESLWTPEPPLPVDAWSALVSPKILPWVAAGYRYGTEWLWAWPPDLPDRLQRELIGGTDHVA